MKGLEEFLPYVDKRDHHVYEELAYYMEALGYRPKRARTKDVNYVFTSNKTKRHILKLSLDRREQRVKAKFYANTEYTHMFRESIRKTIEAFDFRYTGCYGCGKCQDTKQGYYYQYDDGASFFRCGNELIELEDFGSEHLEELKDLLATQHKYYLATGSKV